MGFLSSLFKKTYNEKDNTGTRHDSAEFATAYWITRNKNQKFDPFLLYLFDNESDAKKALLELDCIHEAADTRKLICREMLIFGYYKTERGNFEAILCGEELSPSLYQKAQKAFVKHNGRKKNELAPKKQPPKPKSSPAGQVQFVREDRQQRMGHTMIYRIHKAPNAATAKAFLEKNPVTKQLYYIVVETPEGNYCRDIQGMYKE